MASFADLIAEIDGGRLRQVLDEQLEHVINSVELHPEQSGQLVLRLDIETKNNRVVVAPKVTYKAPTDQASPSLFFFDGKGSLTRKDPRQLPLRMLEPQQEHEETDE